MHAINNTVSCLIDWLQPDDGSGSDILFQTRIIVIALFCLVFMAASISSLKKVTLFQHTMPNKREKKD